jgi:hypothetical protein
MKTHVIYHRKDADGILSAAIACHALNLTPRNSTLYGVDHPERCPLLFYGFNPPCRHQDFFAEDDHVVIVDFSYSKAETQALLDGFAKVTLLDHHQTAVDELAPISKPHWVLDTTRAACQIVWDDLIGTERPWWLDLIGWRDLGGPWQPKADPNKTRHANILNTALFSFAPLDPYRLAQHVPSGTAWQTWFDQGEALCHANQAAAQAIAAAVPLTLAHFPDAVGTLKLPIVFNCHPALTSDVCHHLMKIHNWPTACVCSRSSEAPYSFTFSFRSTPTGPDVSILAKRLGGGGHPRAAGCTLPSLPIITQG